MRLTWAGSWLLFAGLLPATAAAQAIEVPRIVIEAEDAEEAESIDLENVVQTAAKVVTTVQEAPAIVSVVSQETLESNMHRTIGDALDLLPGWMHTGLIYNQFPSLLVRGTPQSVLLLVDGLSVYDPGSNVTIVGRTFPIERVKRIEVVTGPGGVLWGANSFLGIVNVQTRQASDVNGVETGITLGDGRGDSRMARGYLMVGFPDVAHHLDVFAHASFETYGGSRYSRPSFLLSAPFPQPNSPAYYGPEATSDVPYSTLFVLDGTVSHDDLSLSWQYVTGAQYHPLGFGGNVLQEELPEDELDECERLPTDDPDIASPADSCADRGRVARRMRSDVFERYLVLRYQWEAASRTRFDFRAYGQQFVRRFDPLQSLAPLGTLLEGGVGFSADVSSTRLGGAVDGRTYLGDSLTLLYGAEVFLDEWPEESTPVGPGIVARFAGPYEKDRLPFACPLTATWDEATMTAVPGSISEVENCPLLFASTAARTTLGSYASVQWRAADRVALNGGARVQIAPDELAEGGAGYDATVVADAGVVVRLLPSAYFKANFAQGFRPPAFNSLQGNGESVQVVGNPDLTPERSQAFQFELNSRATISRSAVRTIDFRVDYAHTRLDDLVTFPRAAYINSSERVLRSGELLSRATFRDGSRVQLSYSWLRIESSDEGKLRTTPEHWFSLGGSRVLVPNRLELSTMVRVWGGFEDPNRRVDVRDLTPSGPENPFPDPANPDSTITVAPTELVVDRIPASATLQAGVRWWLLTERLMLEGTVENALNSDRYQPDPVQAYSPRAEFLPNPAPGVGAYVSATYLH